MRFRREWLGERSTNLHFPRFEELKLSLNFLILECSERIVNQSHVAVSLLVETSKEMTLNEIVKGQIARITNITGEDAISIRLMEMGLIDGEQIQLLGKAPLGDPLEFAIRGYRLSLRLNEARCVEIELV